MKTFLSEVVEYLLANKIDLGKSEIIVPNNRTRIYILDEFSKQISSAIYAPKITPITQVFYSQSNIKKIDDIFLLAKLYDIYKKYIKTNETLDDFFFWGQILLADFNDIDNYLANAQLIFKNILDIAQIDEQFGEISEEERKIIENFWKNITISANKSEQKEIFLNLAENFYNIYKDFTENLLEEKLAYQGLIYKHVIENLKSENFSQQTYIIVGFNALNECEKQLFSFLKKEKETLFFWDADRYYLDDKNQETGRFLRDLIKKFPPKIDIPNNILNLERNIEIISTPSSIAQTKIINKIIDPKIINKSEDKIQDKNFNTIITLGDENLLVPLLYSFDIQDFKYNVSMGFPLKLSHSYTFLNYLISLQKNIKTSGEFYKRDVENIENHSFFPMFKNNFFNNFIPKRKINDVDDFIKFLLTIFSFLQNKLSDDIEIESNKLIIKQINAFKSSIEQYNIPLSKDIFIKILRNSLRNAKLSFEGEDNKCVQVMGFIESRNLDFENVVMLSLNEDIFPKKSPAQSNIPYNIRKAFGLPAIEFQDSIFAYYFYRILQRSKNVKIVYSSQISDTNAERSRFVTQIIYELDKKINPKSHTTINFTNFGYKISKQNNTISVKKTPEIIEKLNLINEKGIFPSNINTFLNCSLKYYLHFIANLKEAGKQDDDFDAALMGTLLHNTIEYLYKPYLETVLNTDDFAKIKANVDIAIENAVINAKTDAEKHKKPQPIIPDLMLEIIKKYTLSLLDYDKKNVPITILALEKEFAVSLPIMLDSVPFSINLKGKIDRFDYKNSALRVFDYKTGNVKLQKPLDKVFVFDQDHESNVLSQVLLYAYLVYNQEKYKNEIIIPGILMPHKLSDDNYEFKISVEKQGNSFISLQKIDENILNYIKIQLQLIFSDLFNPEIDFIQTKEYNNCKYCEYKTVCERN